MTIASEITRLQGAKSDIRQAIIDKGVSVPSNLTIDDYACCIAEIPTGGGGNAIKLLVVGGGGGGCVGGGGGGEVKKDILVNIGECSCISIGAGGNGGNMWGWNATNGCCSYFCDICCNRMISANGGCFGGNPSSGLWDGGTSGSGCIGGIYRENNAGGGGGGASGAGCESANRGGNGGEGLYGYGGGGGGGAYNLNTGCGIDGGGNGSMNYNTGCSATNCGGGGGGSYYCLGGNGGGGLVEVCYPSDGSYGITCAVGGDSCCTATEGGTTYYVHRFTSNGTFCIVC